MQSHFEDETGLRSAGHDGFREAADISVQSWKSVVMFTSPSHFKKPGLGFQLGVWTPGGMKSELWSMKWSSNLKFETWDPLSYLTKRGPSQWKNQRIRGSGGYPRPAHSRGHDRRTGAGHPFDPCIRCHFPERILRFWKMTADSEDWTDIPRAAHGREPRRQQGWGLKDDIWFQGWADNRKSVSSSDPLSWKKDEVWRMNWTHIIRMESEGWSLKDDVSKWHRDCAIPGHI